jgi:hypothetical protein
LSFWQKYSINNNGGYNCYNIDYALVEISTNGGWNWVVDTFYNGTVSTWYQVQRRLLNYRSDSVKIRFRLTSGYQCEDDGWYIDDVEIKDLTVSVEDITTTIPTTFELLQNYPNPFNPETKIKFQIPTFSEVTLKVFDLLGREVATLVNERLQPGSYETTFDGKDLSSGVYLYRLSAGSFVEAKKFLLLR